MNPLIIEFIKNAANRAIKNGGISFFEELAEAMTVDQLKIVIASLQNALKKKQQRKTITVEAK